MGTGSGEVPAVEHVDLANVADVGDGGDHHDGEAPGESGEGKLDGRLGFVDEDQLEQRGLRASRPLSTDGATQSRRL